MGVLIPISELKAELAQIQTIDDGVAFIQKAELWKQRIKQINGSLILQNEIAMNKTDAERLVGRMLKENSDFHQGRPSKNLTQDEDFQKTSPDVRFFNLSDLGISYNQSSKWQQLADFPDDLYEQEKHTVLERATNESTEWSTAHCLRKYKQWRREQEREDTKKLADVTELPTGTYRTIVIDPPWAAADSGDNDLIGRGKPNYSTMTLDEIQALPVGELAEPDDCHLYLWTTNRLLPHAFELLDGWGFRYITLLTWCKPQIGIGSYFRNSTEHILFAIKGNRRLARADMGTWFVADRLGSHSTKPPEFVEIVESCSPGPKIEMFARSKRDGWTTWGAEVK